MKQRPNFSAFGQADPTDNREPGEWRSKYSDPEPRREIRIEAIYLGCLLVLAPLGIGRAVARISEVHSSSLRSEVCPAVEIRLGMARWHFGRNTI